MGTINYHHITMWLHSFKATLCFLSPVMSSAVLIDAQKRFASLKSLVKSMCSTDVLPSPCFSKHTPITSFHSQVRYYIYSTWTCVQSLNIHTSLIVFFFIFLHWAYFAWLGINDIIKSAVIINTFTSLGFWLEMMRCFSSKVRWSSSKN